jgi:hypothetical protein
MYGGGRHEARSTLIAEHGKCRTTRLGYVGKWRPGRRGSEAHEVLVYELADQAHRVHAEEAPNCRCRVVAASC